MESTPQPIGRLAPSPTGYLHLGNLSTYALAAVRSLSVGGLLLMRIEDLDRPRCVPGAEADILNDLRWLGLTWADVGTLPRARIVRQSDRGGAYDECLETLRAAGHTYPCFCSRRDIAEAASAPHGVDAELRYTNRCRGLEPSVAWHRAEREPHAIRFRAEARVSFVDAIAGRFDEDAGAHSGDFVLRRRDGLHAYQLAVVVDDAASGVTEVVRGRDLLESTARQLALFDALGYPRPSTAHVPVLVSEAGERLSKRSGSVARSGLEKAGWTPGLLLGALAILWGWREVLAPASIECLVDEWAVTPSLQRPRVSVPDALFSGPRAFERWLDSRLSTHEGDGPLSE